MVPMQLPMWLPLLCGLAGVSQAQIAPGALAVQPAFSYDKVADNLQRLADEVPDEGYQVKLLEHHSGCSCGDDQDDPMAEEANSNVDDDDFQVAPSRDFLAKPYVMQPEEASADQPTYQLRLLQKSTSAQRRHERNLHKHGSGSRSGCNCASQQVATSGAAASAGSGGGNLLKAVGSGIFLHTCQYSQPDLVFWRLTNTAYLRSGIVLKETIAYTDSCKMCKYNNVGCNKKEVELKAGNCLCMWRVNGVEMKTGLVPCASCVSECIGVYKTFDVGKPEPAMQRGLCLRKKPFKAFEDLKPLKMP